MSKRLLLSAVVAALLPASALAQPKPEGFLCCNMRTDGEWISDINYAGAGTRVIPAGTPVVVTGYGRYRVYVEIDGKKQALGNDYSRDIDMGDFALRYVVQPDPTVKLAGYSPKVREAIQRGQLMRGMTREQVLMSVGYPVSGENPDLNAGLWRFWRSTFDEFQVEFDGNDRVKEIIASPATRNLLVPD